VHKHLARLGGVAGGEEFVCLAVEAPKHQRNTRPPCLICINHWAQYQHQWRTSVSRIA